MRTISIGRQSFENIRVNNYFYVDKTRFIKEWWESGAEVTLITRPRRFGKTLNMDMLNCFFSNRYAARSDLFEDMDIWKDEKYRQLQGMYPVIAFSFADVKYDSYKEARTSVILTLQTVIDGFSDLWAGENFKKESEDFRNLSVDSPDALIGKSLQKLSAYLEKHYGKKVLILLDEYDTPLQEAYIHGYWDEMVNFIRGLFNSTFKTNTSMERGLMTGITRVSKESIFSDLNNIAVVTTTSRKYETCFGFTQEEVDLSLKEYGLFDQRETVQKWYDGFTFGRVHNIYNPWSILQYLDNQGEYAPYWANTSTNALIGNELRMAGNDIKERMETLLNGGTVESYIDEQIIFSQLETDPEVLWSLFLTTGYLKVVNRIFNGERYKYTLSITNLETKIMFENLITTWFGETRAAYSCFTSALKKGNTESVQYNLQKVLNGSVSFYDTGKKFSEDEKAERFYHGLVLGMVVQETDYRITSNRESGDGRYDILMKPKDNKNPAIIIEFKMIDTGKEKTLEDTAERALEQIETKKYDAELIAEGIEKNRIVHYGMGFSGKNVLVKKR